MKSKKERHIKVEISQRMQDDLNALVRTGLFGVSKEEASRRILEEWLWKNSERINLVVCVEGAKRLMS